MTQAKIKVERGVAYLTGYSVKPKGRRVRELELTSIGSPSQRNFPSENLSLFYGAQATLREMAKVHAEAIRNKQDLYQITVGIDVQKVTVEFLTFEDLKGTRMMNMERISHKVADCIQAYWSQYLHEEGRSDEWIANNVEWRRHRFMSDRPDLVTRLCKEPEFRHLALIIYQVVEGSDVYKVGTVLDPKAIKNAECTNSPGLPVRLPEDHGNHLQTA